jgi:hypothetical protein
METMKRNWVSPVSGVQQFVPQEFVASCENENEWIATCDDYASLIFLAPNGVLQDYVLDNNRGGCGRSHTFYVDQGDIVVGADGKVQPNAYLLAGVSAGWNNTNNVSNYKAYFTEESWAEYESLYHKNDGIGTLELSDAGIAALTPGFFSPRIDGGTALTTTNLKDMRNPS